MASFYKSFGDNVHNTLLTKNGTNFSHKGPWITVSKTIEIDRWHVGDFSSANYIVTAEFTSNKKETFQVSVVARPGLANYIVFGRVSIDDPLIDITAEINNSYVSIKATPTGTAYKGTKLIFNAEYAGTIEQLTIPKDPTFIVSSPVGGSTGSSGSGGSGSGGSTSTTDFGNVGQSILPSTDIIYDLGSPTKRWRDLYLSGNSLYLGDTAITRTSVGAVDLPTGSSIGGTDVFGFGTVRITGNSSTLLAGSLNDTLTLRAGSNVTLVPNAATNTVTINASGGGGGGGSSGPAFSTVSVPGQTPISAGTSADNLNFVAGSGIALVTTPASNTVTIINTGGSGGGSSNATAIKVQEIGTGILPIVVASGTSAVSAQSLYANSTMTLDTNTGTLNVTAAQAKWADLAENYVADAQYEPGTVLEFGGDNEVTVASDETRRVAGVVSTDPAYLMNSHVEGEYVVALALTGRVPCKVRGKIRKGDMLVSGGNGYARPGLDPKMGTVIGKALENFDGIEGVIEVVVGRL